MIRAANKYVIDNWQSLVKLAKKNNLEDMDNLLDQYSRISLRPDILTIWKGAGSMLNLEQTKELYDLLRGESEVNIKSNKEVEFEINKSKFYTKKITPSKDDR